MGYVDDATIAALRGSINLGVFFRLGTPQPIRLSCSVHDFPLSLANLDPAGSLYVGAGRITSIPALGALVNGTADTVTFSLGGLNPIALTLMLDGAPEVLGCACTVAIAPLDASWQPAAAPVRLWTGTADFLAQAMPPETNPTQNRTQTLTLTCMSGDQSRQVGSNATLTGTAQQTLHPGDTACDRTPRYNQNYVCSWPRYS